ncbi:hypothetical protein BJ998_001176 [Kutzneria kofuensis]|uniref:Uncharacterized protein n=1 Tax=Kutzneria kofuensis TaxID=103725 RepID=A0A7W9KCA9_9PSEU|nr:hypothetical protein [Kutzneria kofuensis]
MRHTVDLTAVVGACRHGDAVGRIVVAAAH